MQSVDLIHKFSTDVQSLFNEGVLDGISTRSKCYLKHVVQYATTDVRLCLVLAGRSNRALDRGRTCKSIGTVPHLLASKRPFIRALVSSLKAALYLAMAFDPRNSVAIRICFRLAIS